MKYLIGTTDKLTLLPSSTANLEVMVSFISGALVSGVLQDTGMKPLTQRTLFSTAVEADILTAPPDSNTVYQPQLVTVTNVHASASNTVVIKAYKGGSATEWGPAIPLAAGEAVFILETGAFIVMDATGGIKTGPASGRWLKTTVLTAGTTFTTDPATRAIFLRMVGGGGGGGGCTSVASAAAAAGGGGAGAYAEKTFVVNPSTGYTYAIGAAGNGASGAAGGNGGSTTFAVGATTVTAPGGTGAAAAVAATTLTARAGGAGGTVATNGDVNSGGRAGGYGVTLIVATPIVASGDGGASQFGGGGAGRDTVGNGNAATGFGAGGGGAATGAAAVRTGGNGTAGCIIVDEFA